MWDDYQKVVDKLSYADLTIYALIFLVSGYNLTPVILIWAIRNRRELWESLQQQ